ncbi:MAG: P-loop NTPase [Candidatus Solibacter sp.]
MLQPANRNRTVIWKPVVICPHPEMHRRLQVALTELAMEQPCSATEYPRATQIATQAERLGCNICFIDVVSDSELALSLISELGRGMPVVAMHPRIDADYMLRCLRRGASEFLSEPSVSAAGEIFERLGRVQVEAARRVAGTLYCVIPGKPGCGASTLAAHLAVQLHNSGADRVLLVDGDQLTASIAFMLKLKPQFHLEDVLRDWARMDDDVWSRLTVPAFGLDVLAAPEDPTTRTEVTRQFAAELCVFWKERYDAVVLDLPDVRTSADCGFAAVADNLLLVTTNELAALQATRRGLRYLDSGAADRESLRLILNRSTPAMGLQHEEVKTALAMQPFATLENDYEVLQAAVLEGRPAPASSRYGTSVQALCRCLTHTPAPQKKAESWLSTLLRRKPLLSR